MRSMTSSAPRSGLVLILVRPRQLRLRVEDAGEDFGAAEINADKIIRFAGWLQPWSMGG